MEVEASSGKGIVSLLVKIAVQSRAGFEISVMRP